MRPAGIHVQAILSREPCTAPIHDLVLKEALALLPSGNVQNLSYESMVLSGRGLESPVRRLTTIQLVPKSPNVMFGEAMPDGRRTKVRNTLTVPNLHRPL